MGYVHHPYLTTHMHGRPVAPAQPTGYAFPKPPMPTPKRKPLALVVVALLLAAVGCGSPADPMGDELAPEPTVDAAAAVDVAAPKVDAGREAASPDSAPEAAAPAPDATADAGLDVARAEATAPDAAATPDADAQALVEASAPEAAPKQDAAAEAATVDAAPTSDSGRPTTAQTIAATFPEGCSADGTRKCGGVTPAADGIVETWPLSCYHGAWILAGGFECSHGCAARTLCTP